MGNNWRHDALADDLAAYLRSRTHRMVWVNMQLGPVGSPRPDIFTMQKSFTQPRPLAYEVKISSGDFRRDVTEGKWQSYLESASGVFFACPAGLLNKSDVPRECGLMVRSDDGWKTLRAPVLKSVTTPTQVLLKLLIDGVDRLRCEVHLRDVTAYQLAASNRRRLSKDVAESVCDLQRVRDQIALYQSELAKLQEACAQLRVDVRESAGESFEVKRLKIMIANHFDLDNNFTLDKLREALRREVKLSDAGMLETLRQITDLAGRHLQCM